MRLNDKLDAIMTAFVREASTNRIILFHPDSRYRSIFIAHLINSSQIKVIYYALGPDDIDLPALLSSMVHDLIHQHPTFGRHLNMLDANEKNTDVLLGAFSKDLSELHDSDYFLILDEYDRSDSADDIQDFIEKLVGYLPAHCRLVINSRTLPRLPWVSMIAKHDAVILQDADVIRDDFYGAHNQGANRLEIFALGPGFVLFNDRPIDSWEGHLPRLLFFFVLDRPVITRSEICNAFWPELDIDQAVNVFHVTKRRLHKALDMDVLVHDDGYYSINPELEIHYDVLEFVHQLMQGRDTDNTSRVAAWDKAIELYRGPFLQGHMDSWIVDRRRDFQTGYLEALTEMANVRLNEGRPEHALNLLQRALGENSAREDLHRQVMTLYYHLGRRSEAAAHYQRLNETLGNNGHQLAEETNRVYQAIMTEKTL